jgi:hypothetical protein
VCRDVGVEQRRVAHVWSTPNRVRVRHRGLTQAAAWPSWLCRAGAGRETRRTRPAVKTEIAKITHDAWVRRVITWQLTGEQPKDLRLSGNIDPDARAGLEAEIFGKHVIITDHDHWPVIDVIAGYRSQSEAEGSFRQMKATHVVSFSPMFHWTSFWDAGNDNDDEEDATLLALLRALRPGPAGTPTARPGRSESVDEKGRSANDKFIIEAQQALALLTRRRAPLRYRFVDGAGLTLENLFADKIERRVATTVLGSPPPDGTTLLTALAKAIDAFEPPDE